jgi:hypothetical protein
VVGPLAAWGLWKAATKEVTGTVQSGEMLTVGQCLNETPQGSAPGAEIGDIQTVRCDQPHSDEVVAILSLTHFPNGDADDNDIRDHCTSELQKYSPSVGRGPAGQLVESNLGTKELHGRSHYGVPGAFQLQPGGLDQGLNQAVATRWVSLKSRQPCGGDKNDGSAASVVQIRQTHTHFSDSSMWSALFAWRARY